MKSYIEIAAENGVPEEAIKVVFAAGWAVFLRQGVSDDRLKQSWNCLYDLGLLDALQTLAGEDEELAGQLTRALALLEGETYDVPTCS